MVRAVVQEIVIDALREVQFLGGHGWVEPPAGAAVIGTLEGFDSLTAIEATVLLEQRLAEKLGQTTPVELGVDSIFVSSDGSKALCLDDVVSTVCSSMGGKA